MYVYVGNFAISCDAHNYDSTSIRREFDARSTACQRSLRSQ